MTEFSGACFSRRRGDPEGVGGHQHAGRASSCELQQDADGGVLHQLPRHGAVDGGEVRGAFGVAAVAVTWRDDR